ncbi:MAG: hypothetical protein H6Q74_642 [Firmicutes bacterium]|nr:hypothetical protein [Bacillota bacterium]
MKKKIIVLIIGAMLAASVGFAAPINDLAQGETTVGANHYALSPVTDDVSVYLEHGLSDKLLLGVEYNNNGDESDNSWNTTDIYAQYKLDPNIRLIVGDRNYDYGNQFNKFFYGVGFSTNIAPKIDGYASVTSNNYTTEWQVGVNYKLDDRAKVNLGYKSNKDDGYQTYSGLGFGIIYNF